MMAASKVSDPAPTRVGSEDGRLLQVSGLTVDFDTEMGPVRAVDEVSFEVRPGEVLGLVGESGSGKSVTALSLLQLLPPRARVRAGQLLLGGEDLLSLGPHELRAVRGRRIAMVFQDPLTSLNPLMTVGSQLVEATRVHDRGVTRAEARDRAGDLLRTMGFDDPHRVLSSYPHELSGGMRQRVMIVMAMSNRPDLLVADEPTTALDVSTQAQVLDALQAAREMVGSAMLLISHDLGLVGERADRVHVMYRGRLVETGAAIAILSEPRHPYTIGLLASRPSLLERGRLDPIPGSPPGPFDVLEGCAFAPRCGRRHGRSRCITQVPPLIAVGDSGGLVACHFPYESDSRPVFTELVTPGAPAASGGTEPLLRVVDLVKEFRGRRRRGQVGSMRAVDGVSFDIEAGHTLALVGESGSGKSTVARTVLGLVSPTSGLVRFDGSQVSGQRPRELRRFRAQAQLVQQDPYSALNPRMTVGAILSEALRTHRIVEQAAVRSRVAELLDSVGLRPGDARRFPHEFSGGQRQRICIARALSVEPRLMVLDEPVSSLDVSVQAQILNLLGDIQRQRGIAFLFITHDLAVVRNVADRIAVLRQGRVVESGTVCDVLEHPSDPYTQALLAAVPDPFRTIGVARLPASEATGGSR